MQSIKQLLSLLVSLLLLSVFETTISAQPVSVFKADSAINNKAVYLFYKKNNDTLYSGSGLIVNFKQQYFLVTAAHNTDNMVFETLSVFFTADNSTRVFPIIHFAKNSASSLRTSKSYDLSVIKLNVPETGQHMIDQVTIPAERLERNAKKIHKAMVVLGLGYIDYKGQNITELNPVEQIDSTTVDSGLIKFMRFDNQQPSYFLVLNKIAGRGMSGGPVFNGIDRDDWRLDYKVIGIFHGQFLNDDGKYYTLVTPLKDIIRLFRSY